MYPREQLRRTLARIEGRPYPAYRDLSGAYDFVDFRLYVDHIQADPYAAPSRLRVLIPAGRAGLRAEEWSTTARRIALEDWLLRRLAAALGRAAERGEETGRSGTDAAGPPAGHLRILTPGQQVIERSAIAVRAGAVEIRLTCDLPAERRVVRGGRAAAVLDVALPAAVAAMLSHGAADQASLRAHIALVEDQQALRAELGRRGWIAFLADGSILPRRSGQSDLPLPHQDAVRFVAPESLAATVSLPHRGQVRGLPIPQGITLIVGGAYHGKSTLLRAIERGIYDHIAGDGRELCVTDRLTVSVAAEDGRPVSGVDISAFVGTLPGGRGTERFRTAAASGSTSQAAGLCEAVEMGAACLLLDEDRSAANFMSRDARMRALVPDAEDPVVPFVERVRWLYRSRGVSTVLVVGGAGAFLDTADLVLRMRDYQPVDVTAAAVAVACRLPVAAVAAAPSAPQAARRVPAPEPFSAVVGPGGRVRARPRGRDGIAVGDVQVDLSHLAQICDEAQIRALADMLPRAAAYADGRRTLAEVVADVEADIDRLGLEVLSPWPGQCPGDYARPRGFELAAALNRIPGLRLQGEGEVAPEPLPHRRLARRLERTRPPQRGDGRAGRVLGRSGAVGRIPSGPPRDRSSGHPMVWSRTAGAGESRGPGRAAGHPEGGPTRAGDLGGAGRGGRIAAGSGGVRSAAARTISRAGRTLPDAPAGAGTRTTGARGDGPQPGQRARGPQLRPVFGTLAGFSGAGRRPGGAPGTRAGRAPAAKADTAAGPGGKVQGRPGGKAQGHDGRNRNPEDGSDLR